MSIIYSVELPPGFINITVSSPATADTQHKGRRGKLGCSACTKVAGNLTLQPPSCVPSLHLYPTTPYWSLTGTCHSLARTNTTKCCSSESCSECGGPGGVFKEIQVGVENFIVWQCEDCLPIQHPGVTGGVALGNYKFVFSAIYTISLFSHTSKQLLFSGLLGGAARGQSYDQQLLLLLRAAAAAQPRNSPEPSSSHWQPTVWCLHTININKTCTTNKSNFFLQDSNFR